MEFNLKYNCLTRLLLLFSILGIQCFPSFSMENRLPGGRSLALSHASVSLSDTWSTFHNQAGIADFRNRTSGFFYESKYGIDELSLAAATIILPAGSGAFGISFYQFGKGVFKENKFGLAYAKQLSQKWSTGIQLDYLALMFPENERTRGYAVAEGGLLFRPSRVMVVGVHVFNPLPGEIKTRNSNEKMPAILRAGGHYQFHKSLLAVFEAEKNILHPPRIKAGLEFCPVENLALRAGVSGRPFGYTTGIGFHAGIFQSDIGFSYHTNLGITPSVSIQIDLP